MAESEARVQQPEKRDGSALNFWQKFTYSFGMIGVNLAPGVVVGWMVLFYMERPNPGIEGGKIVLISAGAMAFMGFLGRLVDAIADPLVGYYSDKWKTRWGRRIPWVVLGAPLLSLFTILVWFPPTDHQSWANAIWLGFMLSGMWFFYTVVVAPYLSMVPEITPYQNERVVLSAYMSYATVVGMLMGTLAVGAIFEQFSEGVTIGPLVLSDGYKVGGVVVGILTMIAFFISVMIVREKPADQIKTVRFKFLEAAKECSDNPGFWPYIITVAMLRLGIDIFIMVIPILVITLMGYGEMVAGMMQGGIVLFGALMFPIVAYLANKYGKKKVMSFGLIGFVPTLLLMGLMWHFPFVGYLIAWVAGLFGVTMSASAIILAHCVGLLFFGIFPVAVALILPMPIFADIMDHDEQRTGYRREAMYNGMEGLITKFAAGIATATVPLMLAWFGNTKEHPWGMLMAGPICGVFFFLGWIAFKKHPFDM